ncbi:MAG: hypothetical protein JNM56_23285, partial [Planctomycetia bacterium]|nr:hypothetical protein [Planctomycetia bacterium]
QTLRDEQTQFEAQWREQTEGLDADTPRPPEATAAAVQAALDACRRQHEQEQRQAAFAREWAATLEQQAPTFGQQLVRQANVVAAAVGGLAADPQFGDASGQAFDLLILDEAHLIVEAEWLPLARRARRWVLAGEPAWDRREPAEQPAAPRRDLARPAGRPLSGVRPAPSVPRLFPRLWRQLHVDPRRLPYAWFQEDGRWCCRLRELSPEQRAQLETEGVADRPDIELRIFAQPRLAPVLAEVAFPAGMTIPQAKEFIYRELQELPIQAHGSRIRWIEEPARLILQLDDTTSGGEPIHLEAGVRELLVSPAAANGHGMPHAPSCTHSLEFDRASGWDRRRAEDWVRAHLGVRDLGRTALLETPHRMHPEIAAFVSRLLFDGAYRLKRPTPAPASAHALEFIAVTCDTEAAVRLGEATRARQENGRRGATVTRPRPTRGGAGLETDLTDARHRERLPVELRGDVPLQGFANQAEAQAVVRVLEHLARQPDSQGGQVGVTALYPAQVQLIRNLVRQSPFLKDLPFALHIDEPWAFRGRECQVMLVSLTRSHSHRAVTFGEGPHLFGLALTRARSRLILLGDVGCLQRRCQWDGPVDHLDHDAAGRERDFLHRLLQAWPGDGPHLREGPGS